MNLLNIAMGSVNVISPNQSIIIRTIENKIVNGIDSTIINDMPAVAQIQKLNSQELKDYQTYIESTIYYKFFILGDRIDIVNSIMQTSNSKIIFNNGIYNIFAKDNNSLNGWIRCYGVLINDDSGINNNE